MDQTPPHAIVACSGDGKFIAFAHSNKLRLFSPMENKFIPLGETSSSGDSSAKNEEPFVGHTDVIRVIQFDRRGPRMMTSGDDKRLIVWDCRTGKCLGQQILPKKVSAGRITPNGQLVVADKTGDAYGLHLANLPEVNAQKTSSPVTTDFKVSEANGISGGGTVIPPKNDGGKSATAESNLSDHFLLGHFATITDLEFLTVGKGQYLISSDVERKIRISKYPHAYFIKAFCFGHTSFVTRLDRASFETQDGAKIPLLLSGGGDGTVRLWEPSTGRLLDTYPKHAPYHSQQSSQHSSLNSAPMETDKVVKVSVAPNDSVSAASSVASFVASEAEPNTKRDSESKIRKGKIDEVPHLEPADPVVDLSVSRWQNLTAVHRLGENKVEILNVTQGTLKPHWTISLDHTPLAISFDPQAHLWVLINRGTEGIGVDVYGLSGDGNSMKRLEINDTLKQTLFPEVDPEAKPLIHEYLRAYSAKTKRKKMRLAKTVGEKQIQASHSDPESNQKS